LADSAYDRAAFFDASDASAAKAPGNLSVIASLAW
jgi:hypothetical protein